MQLDLSKLYSCATLTLTAAPRPEQKWTSPGENIIALAEEDLVWRLVRVNHKGLLCALHVRGGGVCVCVGGCALTEYAVRD